MSTLRLDPEFGAVVQPTPNTPVARDGRLAFSSIVGSMRSPKKPRGEHEIAETLHSVPSIDGAYINVYCGQFACVEGLRPYKIQGRPALIWVHGGGYILNELKSPFFPVPGVRQANMADVAVTGTVLFAVDYRLAPEHPFPAALGDIIATLSWVSANAVMFGIDRDRIGLAGSSAGGGLAAAAALLARDVRDWQRRSVPYENWIAGSLIRGIMEQKKNVPHLARLVLFYPMLDNGTDASRFPPDHPLVPFLTWGVADNEHGWCSYLGNNEDETASPYAVPACATDLSHLPRTYIDVGGVDLFRDEVADFAARLLKANVEVEMHVWPGLPHSFEDVEEYVPITELVKRVRTRALGDF